jgi:hypothetical protein
MRAKGISITFACESCGSIIDSTREGFKVLTKFSQQKELLDSLAIPLGSRGVLFEVEWEIIGFLTKQDVTWEFCWDEYLLFNPYHGFRFLIHSDGHFSFAEVLTKRPVGSPRGRTIGVDDAVYSLFHRGVCQVKAVVGEFYWRVRLDDCCDFADFVSAPQGITMEVSQASSDAEATFSRSRYLPLGSVEAAFGISSLPTPFKVSPTQPNYFDKALTSIRSTVILCCMVVFLSQLYFVARCKQQQVLQTSRTFTRAEAGAEQLIGEIEIRGNHTNVEIQSDSPVMNSWVEVAYELESEDGTESGWASQAIEYYYGYSGGESWSEGSTREVSTIGGLGAKRYKVFATVDADSFSRDLASSLVTRITADVPIWSNFFLAIGVLLALPCFLFFRGRVFERKRWEESDYSPYDSE